MAVNKNFSEFYNSKSGEWKLLHELIVEAIEMAGLSVFYIPKDITTRDDIFGADIGANLLDKTFEIPMAPLNFKSFKDSAFLFSKMGINVTDKLSLVVAQDVFEKKTGYENALSRVGDIIYIPLLKKCNKSAWEIRSITPYEEDNVMQFGDEHIYIFGCEVLKLDSTDKMKTPLEEINRITDFIDNLATLEKTEVDRRIDNIAPDFDEGDPFNNNR
jgi:hypothetical protein